MCYYILYFYYILYHFQPIAKISILAYRYIGRRLVAEVSSACSNYSHNEAQVTIWTIRNILMKIPTLKNTGKLYLKLHRRLFIIKSDFCIMHIISRTFCSFNMHLKTKMLSLGNLLPGNMLSDTSPLISSFFCFSLYFTFCE